MSIIRYTTIFLLSLMFLVGCSKSSSIEKDPFSEFIQVNDLNTKLRVYAPESVNDFKITSGVTIVIDNLTNDLIKLYPPGEGIKLFVKTNNGWREIKDLMYTYPPSSEIGIAPPHDNLPGGSMFSVSPDVSERTTVRIVLIGHIYQNGEPTNQKVGAYTDVTVSP
jgi:hypothetical protein